MALCKSFSAAALMVALLLAGIGSSNIMQAAMAQSCTTNGASPTQADANTCVQYVRNLGSSSCCQQGGSGSCTTMCSSGSAAVQICGSSSCTTCANAGSALNTILANCVANVGGTARVSGSISEYGFTFQIAHS